MVIAGITILDSCFLIWIFLWHTGIEVNLSGFLLIQLTHWLQPLILKIISTNQEPPAPKLPGTKPQSQLHNWKTQGEIAMWAGIANVIDLKNSNIKALN